ncbi:MAG: hypothetical protein CMJ78_05710 [Planctomycetaceae bacterium]|nr:hypothetical protein [Planctomycetaceae bacterium]
MQLQDNDDKARRALEDGNLASADLPEAERELLELVRTITLHAYKTTDDQVEKLRQLQWTDEQIAEAVYIAALFAFFNRVADAFGLANPNYDDLLKGRPVASLTNDDKEID